MLGTAAYLSPEQARGEEAGPASDIYSLGVCAYQFLAGRLPHEYSSLTELALKQQNDTVEPIVPQRPEVPATLDRAIGVALHADPERRYSSALEMAQAVTAGARGEDTEATMRLAAAAYEDDAATQALPRTQYERQIDPTMVAPIPVREREPERAPPARPAHGARSAATALAGSWSRCCCWSPAASRRSPPSPRWTEAASTPRTRATCAVRCRS